jgi:hypothetical protein
MSTDRNGGNDEQVQSPPRNDAYTGMLIVSLLALIVSCILLFLDYSRYPERKPPMPPTVAPVSLKQNEAAPAPAPAPAPEQKAPEKAPEKKDEEK